MLELEDRQQIKERSSSLHGVLPVTVQNRCPTWLVIREGRGGAVGPEEGLHPQAGWSTAEASRENGPGLDISMTV